MISASTARANHYSENNYEICIVGSDKNIFSFSINTRDISKYLLSSSSMSSRQPARHVLFLLSFTLTMYDDVGRCNEQNDSILPPCLKIPAPPFCIPQVKWYRKLQSSQLRVAPIFWQKLHLFFLPCCRPRWISSFRNPFKPSLSFPFCSSFWLQTNKFKIR